MDSKWNAHCPVGEFCPGLDWAGVMPSSLGHALLMKDYGQFIYTHTHTTTTTSFSFSFFFWAFVVTGWRVYFTEAEGRGEWECLGPK